MSRRLPQCGAPDLTTFKAATSSDEQRAMHAEPEAAKRAAVAAGLLYPPTARPPFQEPEPKPSRPDPALPGPDLSSFQELAPSPEPSRPPSGAGGMKRNALSIGSQMWAWGSKTPSQSRENSLRGGSVFASLRLPGRSREGSAHGGNAFATGTKSTEGSNNSLSGMLGSLRQADLMNWSQSRGGSRSVSPAKAARSPGMKREGSIGARLWSWATEPGEPEINQMRKAKDGPDLSTFDPKGRTFDAEGKTFSVISPRELAVPPTPSTELRPQSPDKTHTDRGV